MQLNKLDWEVVKVPLFDGLNYTGFYSTKRLDTEGYLGLCGKNYPLLQNQQLLEICQELCNQTGYELFLEEPINGGKQVIISLKCGEVKVGDDTLISQINVANSFDRSSSVCFNYGDLTIRCKNQFNRVVKNSQFRFNHDSYMMDKIEKMIKSIGALNVLQETHYNNLERFVHTKLSKDLAIKQISTILDFEFEIDGNTWEYGDISTRKKNQFDRFVNAYEIEERDLGQTVYSYFNSGTRYSTHVLEQPYSNQGLKISNQIYDSCLTLI